MSKHATFLNNLMFLRSLCSPSPKKARKRQLKKDYETLSKSPLFDATWYLVQYPDIAIANIDPVEHYLLHGWREGRRPNAQFDGNAYLNANPDVKKSKVNPLVHYINQGMAENRPLCSPNATPAPALKPRYIPRSRHVFFSVIILRHHHGDSIRDTLDSLLRQTYQNFEVIVVDDGADDSAEALLSEYASRHQTMWRIQRPEGASQGLAAALEAAAKQARGEYIAFCYAGDYWSDHHLEQVNQAIRKTGIYIMVNDVELSGDEERVRLLQPVVAHRKQTLLSSGGVIPPHIFREANYIVTLSCCCVYTPLLKSCNVAGCTHLPLLDWWISQQMCLGEQIYYLHEKLTCWRMHASVPPCITKDDMDGVAGIDAFKAAMDKIRDARSYVSSMQSNSTPAGFDLFAKLENVRKGVQLAQQIRRGDFKNLKVLYVTTTARVKRPIMDASSRYRCYHGAETISRRGGYAYVEAAENFAAHPNYDYDLYVFHRPSVNVLPVINELKGMNKLLVADYDDLIFGHQTEAVQSSIYKNKVRTLEHVVTLFANNLKALLAFDYVSVSTENLKRAVQRFNPTAVVSVVHNFIPNSIFRIAENLRWAESPKNVQMVMYCSGTLSHNKDFPIAEAAMLKALDGNPQLQFIVQGVLEAGEKLKNRPRVYFHGPVDYWKLFPIMTPAAFNIAPLEDSPFNDCKSNVKFLEASLTGNLLIATPIEDMRRVADAHIFLPENASDWEYYLTHLEELYSPQKALENFRYVRKNCSENTFVAEFRSLFE